ncbi:hypothetical protein D3C75_259640 [compost metagenome]
MQGSEQGGGKFLACNIVLLVHIQHRDMNPIMLQINDLAHCSRCRLSRMTCFQIPLQPERLIRHNDYLHIAQPLLHQSLAEEIKAPYSIVHRLDIR